MRLFAVSLALCATACTQPEPTPVPDSDVQTFTTHVLHNHRGTPLGNDLRFTITHRRVTDKQSGRTTSVENNLKVQNLQPAQTNKAATYSFDLEFEVKSDLGHKQWVFSDRVADLAPQEERDLGVVSDSHFRVDRFGRFKITTTPITPSPSRLGDGQIEVFLIEENGIAVPLRPTVIEPR